MPNEQLQWKLNDYYESEQKDVYIHNISTVKHTFITYSGSVMPGSNLVDVGVCVCATKRQKQRVNEHRQTGLHVYKFLKWKVRNTKANFHGNMDV